MPAQTARLCAWMTRSTVEGQLLHARSRAPRAKTCALLARPHKSLAGIWKFLAIIAENFARIADVSRAKTDFHRDRQEISRANPSAAMESLKIHRTIPENPREPPRTRDKSQVAGELSQYSREQFQEKPMECPHPPENIADRKPAEHELALAQTPRSGRRWSPLYRLQTFVSATVMTRPARASR
jgi:hypothetical protein